MDTLAEFTPVDRKSIAVWRWESTAFCAIILAITAAPVLGARLPVLLGTVIIVALGVAILPLALWYPAAKYRRLSYRLDGAGITIREGVFWRVESSVARARIQHTDVYQGPLQRRYGVATLKLYTAGSSYTKIELPGLSHAVAVGLRDELQHEGDDDAI